MAFTFLTLGCVDTQLLNEVVCWVNCGRILSPSVREYGGKMLEDQARVPMKDGRHRSSVSHTKTPLIQSRPGTYWQPGNLLKSIKIGGVKTSLVIT